MPISRLTNFLLAFFLSSTIAVAQDGWSEGLATIEDQIEKPDYSTLHTIMIFVVAFLVIGFIVSVVGWVYHWRQLCKFRAENEVTGVHVDPITGIRSVDDMTEEKLINIVEQHVGDADFSVEQMAREMGMSRGQLHKRMTLLTGFAPLEYMRRYRLERSRQYLTESQMSVAEVAYQVGFNSPKLYSHYFKEIYGQLPSEYRQK